MHISLLKSVFKVWHILGFFIFLSFCDQFVMLDAGSGRVHKMVSSVDLLKLMAAIDIPSQIGGSQSKSSNQRSEEGIFLVVWSFVDDRNSGVLSINWLAGNKAIATH